jgi:hypothetical protein
MDTDSKYYGSSFDSFLKNEGIFEEVEEMAVEKYLDVANKNKSNIIKFPSDDSGFNEILEA